MSLTLQPTMFADAWLLSFPPIVDARGFFRRTFCADGLAVHGLETRFAQHSMSYSPSMGTLRGLHYQRDPHDEVKIVRCIAGEIFDVIVDLRPGSPTYRRWQGFHLSRENGLQLYVPKGFAIGFQSLTPNVEVAYMISTRYEPSAATGVRFDDPAFGIDWPLPVTLILERDRSWPDFAGA